MGDRNDQAHPSVDREKASPDDNVRDAAYRSTQQEMWVDIQVRQVMRQGDFDNLPGAGKPIEGLDGAHDPDWWAKKLIEREQITGLAPPAILLRNEDAELDDRLDREGGEAGVRRIVEDFNARVRDAQRQLLGGPPVVTKTRDVDEQVEAWRARRQERRAAQRRRLEAAKQPESVSKRRRRWRFWSRD